MSHMVIYRSVEGQPVFHQVESLEDAARHVETLRNAGQGGDARIFSMKEVKIEVKTYYRVEVASEDEKPAAAPAAPVAAAPAPAPAAPAAPAAPVAEAPAAPVAAPAPAAVKPEPAIAGAGAGAAAAANGGRFGLFGKG